MTRESEKPVCTECGAAIVRKISDVNPQDKSWMHPPKRKRSRGAKPPSNVDDNQEDTYHPGTERETGIIFDPTQIPDLQVHVIHPLREPEIPESQWRSQKKKEIA